MARPEKVAAVQEIAGRFQEAPAALLTEYRGLSVSDIAEVRGALREADTDYKVLKNTLARIAVREVGLEELVDMLEGPTAIAFVRGDAVAAAKALDEAASKFPVLVVKGGVLNGKIMDADQAKALARVEPREVQLAKIAGMFNSPLQQTANVLSALLRNFGSMLAQVLDKKESGELPAGPEAQGGAGAGEPEGTPASETGTPEEAQVAAPDETPGETIESDEVGPGADAEPTPTEPEATADTERSVDAPTEPDAAEVTDAPPAEAEGDDAGETQSQPADK